MVSPATRAGSTSDCCWSLPERTSAVATTLHGRSGPGATCAPNAWATRARSDGPFPLTLPPPSSSGTSSEVQPSSAPWRQKSGSKPASSARNSRTLGSGHSLPRNFRVVSRKNSWSSVSTSSMASSSAFGGVRRAVRWSAARRANPGQFLHSAQFQRTAARQHQPGSCRGFQRCVSVRRVGVLSHDPEETAVQLRTWLGEVAGLRGVAVGHLEIPGGTGFSNETILFDATWDEAARRRSTTSSRASRRRPTPCSSRPISRPSSG